MNFERDILRSSFTEYLNIPRKAFQQKIRYYERNKASILQLPFNEFMQIQLDYIFALFEVKEHDYFLSIVDEMIENVISENVFTVNQTDIYKELLTKKAIASYNVLDYKTTERVAIELVRMYPDDYRIKSVLLKNEIDRTRFDAQKTRGVIIALLLFAGLIIAVELLLVRSLFPAFITEVEMTRNLLIFSAIFIFAFHEIFIRLKANKNLNRIKQK